MFRLDKQFQHIQDTTISITRNIVAPSFSFDRDSNIILTTHDAVNMNYFGKINKRGYVKSWKIDSSLLGFPANSLIVRKDSLLYSIFYDYRFVNFDTAFNKIHESQYVFGIGSNATLIPLNDSVVGLSGKKTVLSLMGQRHFFGITTLSGRELFKTIYSTSADTSIWSAWNYGTDTTKLGEWYWGGTYNFILGSSGHSFSPSSFILHKLNRDFSTKWTKRYGGDAYYEMYGVLTTDDGGCMMYGTRYDYNNIPKYDAYILKANADGLKTSESFIPIPFHSIDIYPNPSNGLLNLDFKEPLSDAHIRVIDKQGRLVHQTKLQDNISLMLDLSFLNNGVYFIQVFEKNRLFAANKWIKKSE